MLVYTISYYLKEDSHNCDCTDHNHSHQRDDYEIITRIKALGPWAHFMPNSFLVKTDLNSNEILSYLKKYVEDKDIIFVNNVNKEDVASSTSGVIEWINK